MTIIKKKNNNNEEEEEESIGEIEDIDNIIEEKEVDVIISEWSTILDLDLCTCSINDIQDFTSSFKLYTIARHRSLILTDIIPWCLNWCHRRGDVIEEPGQTGTNAPSWSLYVDPDWD